VASGGSRLRIAILVLSGACSHPSICAT
jgi:hypothetical protein